MDMWKYEWTLTLQEWIRLLHPFLRPVETCPTKHMT